MRELERWAEEVDRYLREGPAEYQCWCQSDGKLVSCVLAYLGIDIHGRSFDIDLRFAPEFAEVNSHFPVYTKKINPHDLHPKGTTRKDLILQSERKAENSVNAFFRQEGLLPSERVARLVTAVEARGRFAINSYILERP